MAYRGAGRSGHQVPLTAGGALVAPSAFVIHADGDAGVIQQIVYLGSESVYDVELGNGRRVKALRSNLTRRDQEDFTWDEPVWLAWPPAIASPS